MAFFTNSNGFIRALSLSVVLGATGVFADANTTSQSTHNDRSEKSTPGYIGLLGGMNSAATSDTKMDGTVGLTLGAKMNPNFGIAFYGSYFGHSSSHSVLGLPIETATKTYTATGQANLFAADFHIGGEAGVGITSWTGSVSRLSAGESNTAFIYGPELGYDFRMTPSVSLGVEGHYLFTNADGGENNIQALGSVKFWM